MSRVCMVRLVGLLSACVLGLSACAVQMLHTARTIEPGATQGQVKALLGEPQERQARGNQAAWQYCETGVVQDTFVVLWFVESTVTGMSTYHNAVGDRGFFCSSHLQSIRWEDAPDGRREQQQR